MAGDRNNVMSIFQGGWGFHQGGGEGAADKWFAKVLKAFLAVQNSSIGDLVTDSLTDWLTEGTFTFDITEWS